MMHLILFTIFFATSSETIIIPQNQYIKVTIEIREGQTLKEVYSSTKEEDIKLLEGTLKGKSAPNFKCGYTGKIIFHSASGKEEADFNITSCNHIVYMKGDKLMSRQLSKKSIETLKSLTKK
jgi:hypothetical protein